MRDSPCCKRLEIYFKNVLFGLGRMVYTVKNRRLKVPGMEYEDGASMLFLYTKGTKEIPNEVLKQFLHCMEDTKY